jgi:hypothetical protein
MGSLTQKNSLRLTQRVTNMAKTPRRREFDSVRQFKKFGDAMDKLGNKSSGPANSVNKLEDTEYYERKFGADIIEGRGK